MVTMRGVNAGTLLPPSLLAQTTSPTYFLWCDEDPMGRADVARGLVSHLPNARLERKADAGHASSMDDPDRLAERVVAFLPG